MPPAKFLSYLLSSNSYLYFTDEEIKQLETVENVQSLNSSSDVSQSRFYASKNLSLHQTICVCTSGTMSFHNFSTLSSPNLLQHKAVVLNQVHPPPQTHTCTRTRAHTHTQAQSHSRPKVKHSNGDETAVPAYTARENH